MAHLMGERDNEGTVAGTPAFMAPEQARGEVTPACDQYALGRTLLFALVGKLPSRSADAMDAPFFAPETSVENFSVDVPAPLRAVVARATAPDPRDRYPSITAFAEALAAIDLGEAAGRARPSLLEPVRPVERFTWTVGARAIETLGGDLEKAEFSLGALVKAGLVDRARAKAFCASTGYRDFAWAVYARRETLGAIASGRALAAARFAVVLCHGLFTSRHIWRPVAVAVCRNNPQAVVLAPDLYGTGESSCRDDVTEAQLEPTALKTVLRKWIALIGLEGVPQVLLGHSFSAMAVLAATDADFGPNVRRVAMTPLFPTSMERAWLRALAPLWGALLPALKRLFFRLALKRLQYSKTHSPDLRRSSEALCIAAPPWLIAANMRALAKARPVAPVGLLGCVVVLADTVLRNGVLSALKHGARRAAAPAGARDGRARVGREQRSGGLV